MNPTQTLNLGRVSKNINASRGKFFGFLIVGALLAFELFNYTTTDYALNDFLGGLTFVGIRWATILAIAFCAIDFAGIARLFTPEKGEGGPKEVWYLFGAWLLAACMNALLTWWGVSLAIESHSSSGASLVPPDTLLMIVPIFVAILVWLIRVLIIGTFSLAGNRLFSQAESYHRNQPAPVMHRSNSSPHTSQVNPVAIRPALKPSSSSSNTPQNRPEPTYHPAGMNGYRSGNNNIQH